MRDPVNKIKTLEEFSKIARKLKSENKKIVLSHGVFDFLHYGHMYCLKQAKNLADVHVVSMVVDKFVRRGPNRPVFKENIRANSLASLEFVDYVIPCHNLGPWDIIAAIKPDIYAKGGDSLDGLKNPDSGLSKDKRIVESVGGRIHFTKSSPIHSAEIIRNYFNTLPLEVNSFLLSFKKNYPVSEVVSKIESLKKMKVLVIGEAIIDEYRYVRPLGKPAKANIIAAQYLNKEEFAGGSLACANHVANICDNVDLVTYLGEKDSKKTFIKSRLKPNIKPTFFYCPDQPTIVKRRFVDPAYFNKYFEEYVFDKSFLPRNVEAKIESFLKKNLPQYDLVIAVDYGHGLFSPRLIKMLSDKSKFLAVNAQTNSGNFGFNYVIKYPRADYICIDENEARLAVHDNSSDIKKIMLSLTKKMSIKKLVVTMGHRGSIAYERGAGFKTIPSLVQKVTDPIGAGDAFLAISAPCAAAGFPIDLVSFMGNVAGSIAVGILGNKSAVEKDGLLRNINYLLE